MKSVCPYLNFDGRTEEAFNYYKLVFGGEFIGNGLSRMSDEPGVDELPITDEEKNRIMHVSLALTKDIILMGSDILPSLGHQLITGNNNYICLIMESREEADRIYNALSEGGVIETPIGEQFWGDYFGSLKDKFGVCWMISYELKPQ